MHGPRRTFGVLAVLMLGLAIPALAQSPVGSADVGTSQIAWRSTTNSPVELTVSGPAGFYLRQTFATGESVTFSAFNEDGSLRPAGAYAFEVKANPVLADQIRAERGEDGALAKAATLPTPRVASGYFSIIDGAFEMGGEKEPGPAVGGNRLATKGVVLTNGDGIIRNSLCVGFDCPDSPTFSDSTILMMENNTRVKFGDTSNSPFPNNDWEIEANSSSSGGANYLGFNDCGTADNDGGCATDLVFAVEAGARQNALYVESDGDVGFGTSNPVVNLHAVDGNTPTLRLEQDGSSGFAPQTWDVAGNETNFFIRDVTGGSTLPFRIRPGAPSSSIYIDASGNVGIGTSSPAYPISIVRSSTGTQDLLNLEASNGSAQTVRWRVKNAAAEWFNGVTSLGNLSFNDAGDGIEMFLTPTGNLTITGTLTTGGPTCGSGCDRVFSSDFDLESIEEHAGLMWSEQHLPAVGPTVPGGPMNVSEKTGGIINELEKAHIYIERLNEELKAKDDEIADLQARMARLEAAIAVRE